jgi:mono/diheme cytochrome c family protein
MRLACFFILVTAALAENAANGRRIYTAYGCYQCHGREAQGSSITGPRLGPRPVAFVAFKGYVRHPTGQMPPYSTKIVTDQEIEDIYAFLKALPKPAPVESIPQLR